MKLNQESINNVKNYFDNKKDNFFITSISYEERCLGIPNLLHATTQFQNIIFFIFNEEDERTKINKMEFYKLTKNKYENIVEITVSDENPVPSITTFYNTMKLNKKSSIVLDISTMPVKHLLIVLKTLDDLLLWDYIKIFYTEPRNYKTELYLPMSVGIKSLDTIWEFIGDQSASLPPLLIEFLGYEGDRAKAVYKNFESEETILVIPKPAFYPEWEGKTERFNNTLLKLVGSDNIIYSSPLDLGNIISVLEKIKTRFPLEKYRWTIVPLGTKPQALGTYLFWRKNPNTFSIIYADPLKNNIKYSAEGIGISRILLES